MEAASRMVRLAARKIWASQAAVKRRMSTRPVFFAIAITGAMGTARIATREGNALDMHRVFAVGKDLGAERCGDCLTGVRDENVVL